jgi:EAL domain-containing protein (putative c-di-GMP-specific phosphodiesterase class I)
MGYLQQMPFDTLKIDRSLVAGVCVSIERRTLVEVMIRLAHVIGLDVVCEGVEAAEEAAVLRELGCNLLQGYLISRPGPLDELMLSEPASLAAVA